MSYLAYCTFDLKNATSSDYDNAYADLKKIGLDRVIVADNGNKVVMPTTSVIGKFDGSSSGEVRDHVRDSVKKAFKSRGFTSEIFVIVGGDWAWGAATT